MKKTLLLVITILTSLTSFGSIYLFDKTICQNDVGTETWTTGTSGTPYTWKWYKYNYSSTTWTIVGSTISSTSSSHPVTVSDTGYYKVVRQTGVTLVDSDYSHLTLIPTPNSGVMYGGDTVCNGSSFTLYDTGYSGSSLSNGWEIPTNSNVSSSNTLMLTTSTIITGMNPGIDTIYFTTTNTSSFGSCGIDTTVKVITVLPTSSGTILGIDTVCIGHTINLTDTTNGGVWTTGGNTTINSVGVVTGVSIGFDTVKYTVTNTCGTYFTTKIIEVKDCSSLSTYNLVRNNDVNVFPNPSTDFITISSDFGVNEFVIRNMIGQSVLTGVSSKNVQINISHFPSGIYFITFNGNKVVRMIKQ